MARRHRPTRRDEGRQRGDHPDTSERDARLAADVRLCWRLDRQAERERAADRKRGR